MWMEITATGAVILGGTWATLWYRRQGLYATLREQQAALVGTVPAPALRPMATPQLGFTSGPVVLDDVLEPATFQAVRDEALRLADAERSYLPAHKKGGTVAYETLNRSAPHIVALYLSPALHARIGQLTGETVRPTPIHDQSSLSVLFYDRPGDHINWHYDHNFYRGRHFTVLIPLQNDGSDEGALSHARLIAKVPDAATGTAERAIATPPNRLVLFEGARVLHKVTPIHEGERRVVLSMTFCTDPRNTWWQGVARRVKDVGFYGVRALWT